MLIEYPHSLNLLTDVSYVLQQQNSTISFSSNQITLFIRCQLLCCVYFIILKNQKPIASSAEFQCHFPASYFVVGGKCTGNINKNVYCLFLFIFKRVASEKVH